MPVDPVKIPQNVQIEDKIIGPLSLRQMIIIMAGGGISYVIYAMIQKTYGSITIPLTVIAWTPCAVAAAFALVKVNDLSLLRICFLLLERMQKPSVRTWAPRRGIFINIRVSGKLDEKAAQVAAAASQEKSSDRIAALSAAVDQTLPVQADDPASAPDTVADLTAPAHDAVLPANDTLPVAGASRPGPPLPVDPTRIKADKPIEPETPKLSDLSVFRDIFPAT
jgi:hypothetical protein